MLLVMMYHGDVECGGDLAAMTLPEDTLVLGELIFSSENSCTEQWARQ